MISFVPIVLVIIGERVIENIFLLSDRYLFLCFIVKKKKKDYAPVCFHLSSLLFYSIR